jgi:excisionase family DNA binding protein
VSDVSVREERRPPEIMTVRDLQAYMRCSRSFIYAHLAEIPHIRVDSLVRFRRDRVLEWLASREQGGGDAG